MIATAVGVGTSRMCIGEGRGGCVGYNGQGRGGCQLDSKYLHWLAIVSGRGGCVEGGRGI